MTAAETPRLSAILEGELASAGIPGCSIAVVNASGPVWCGGFGFADLRGRRRATPETVYHLFSGTKLFTAAAVLHLAERGLLALEDPVTEFIPEAEGARGITLLHLLSHRSGLKDTLAGFLSVSFPPEEPRTTAQALARYRIVAARPPRRVPQRQLRPAGRGGRPGGVRVDRGGAFPGAVAFHSHRREDLLWRNG